MDEESDSLCWKQLSRCANNCSTRLVPTCSDQLYVLPERHLTHSGLPLKNVSSSYSGLWNSEKVEHAVNTSSLGLTARTLKPALCLTLAVICPWPLSNKITACFHSERSAERGSHKVQRGRGFRGRDNGLSGRMQRGLDQQEAHPVRGCTSHTHALSMQITAWAKVMSSKVTVTDTSKIKGDISCSFSGSLFFFRSLLEKVYTL